MRRRELLLTAAGTSLLVRPAFGTSSEMEAAIRGYADGRPVTRGKVKLLVPALVENGNAVPLTVKVDSPMTADQLVTGIAVFNDRNPQRDVIRFTLGPRSGRAEVSSRIRLATSQQLVAVARMNDGTYWSDAVDVLVTLAACLE
jgi:sulfur-oxidizing protein SoxY